VSGPARHAAEVVALFDAEAPGWERNYQLGGGMTTRFERFSRALEQAIGGSGRVLDFGCGTGALARGLARRGWRVSGTDASDAMLSQARQLAPDLELVPLPLGGPLPFADRSFDAVVASSVFEYLADPNATLREIARVLAPGGVLLCTVPDPRDPARRRERLRQAVARFEPAWWLLRRTRWANYAGYLRLSINRMPLEQWSRLAEAAGLRPGPVPGHVDGLALLIITNP